MYELDKIHASYSRLKYDKLIPCNCAAYQGSQEPYFYPFDELREFLASGQHDIQCRKKPFQMVNVRQLMDDAGIPATTTDRTRQKYNDLQARWELVHEKLRKLEKELVLTVDAATQFRLEKQIEEVKADLKKIEAELEVLE
jgi:hypothetical protein